MTSTSNTSGDKEERMCDKENKWAPDPVIGRLLSCLEKEGGGMLIEEDLTFLNLMFNNKSLHALVNVYNRIRNGASDKLIPVISSSLDVLADVLEDMVRISPYQMSEDCRELFQLLQKPHVQSILHVHDVVAQKDYYPRLPEIPRDAEDDEETVKIVQLVKSNEPLGATIKKNEQTGKIVIARVLHGGAADRSGLIHVGDEVIEVNGINVEGKTPNDVLTILQHLEGTITFKLVPGDGKYSGRESRVRVRAHFDYDASSDPYIPCKEAGLDFTKGDVLHIVSQDDAYWWQARKEGDRNMRAGLIPSRALQERRIIYEREQMAKNGQEEALCSSVSASSSCVATPGVGSKTKKIIYDISECDDFDREHIATYEEVAKLYPRPGIYRPIVLIGPPGVGRNELKRRLIDTDPNKYKTPTPYTTRPMRPGEEDGKEYFFISREKMEEDVETGKFIEFGEYKGNLYGTSADSVKEIVNSGKVCILNPHFQALRMLRTPQLKPYIIYIKPPSLEVLKETRGAMHARSTFDANNSRGFTDEEFEDILKSAAKIEFLYDHFFDETIVNADLAIAFSQLLAAANRLETEPLWVPASWVQ